MSEPRTIKSQERNPARGEKRVIRAVENGGGTYHIAMEVFTGDKIAATGGTHLYPQNEEELQEQWEWARNWLKSDYPRLMPEHGRGTKEEQEKRAIAKEEAEKAKSG